MTPSHVLLCVFVAGSLKAIASQRTCPFQPPWKLNASNSPSLEDWDVDDMAPILGRRECSVRNHYFYRDPEQFHLHTAAECFYYTGANYLNRKPCLALPFICFNGNARSFSEGDCHLPDTVHRKGGLAKALEGVPGAEFRWLTCVKAAVECCQRIHHYTYPPDTGHCRATWDALTCFDDATPGSIVDNECPKFLYEKPPKCVHTSQRLCLLDGTWRRKPNKTDEYTDYSGCTLKEREEEIASVYYFAITLYTFSVLFCLPAVTIFSSFRALRCQRISMHKQLVLSVMLSSLFQLIEHSVLTLPSVSRQASVSTAVLSRIAQNTWWCKALQVLQKYFWASQFAWMLCEGIYLHTLVSQAFIDYRSLTSYYAFGWGIPAVCVIIYAVLSACFTNGDCWRSITLYDYIVTIPATLCLLLNVVLMVRVMVILVAKLRGPDSSGDEATENNLKRVFRAVLLLTPLFGVHYVVSMFASGAACANALLTSYIAWCCISSQGIFVSLVLCYCNGEVQFQLKRTYARLIDSRRFELVASVPHKRYQHADARMSMLTVHSDASSGLFHRPSLV
ncbi:calcitonin gene-related peptide type 1 receptor-like isoform X2 [Varroa jacobsoni]|uniref:calcitonin gene-related peptide type 1 receptor-like isoform X2 n=1 Tax=Varroa jacobsoni TaxID=62625 RepID=UPI000BF3B662|nr:calcitonin gene-related peptide type 1 receptor-like isoform X2 [Varroa jacobsoni]